MEASRSHRERRAEGLREVLPEGGKEDGIGRVGDLGSVLHGRREQSLRSRGKGSSVGSPGAILPLWVEEVASGYKVPKGTAGSGSWPLKVGIPTGSVAGLGCSDGVQRASSEGYVLATDAEQLCSTERACPSHAVWPRSAEDWDNWVLVFAGEPFGGRWEDWTARSVVAPGLEVDDFIKLLNN